MRFDELCDEIANALQAELTVPVRVAKPPKSHFGIYGVVYPVSVTPLAGSINQIMDSARFQMQLTMVAKNNLQTMLYMQRAIDYLLGDDRPVQEHYVGVALSGTQGPANLVGSSTAYEGYVTMNYVLN